MRNISWIFQFRDYLIIRNSLGIIHHYSYLLKLCNRLLINSLAANKDDDGDGLFTSQLFVPISLWRHIHPPKFASKQSTICIDITNPVHFRYVSISNPNTQSDYN